MPETFETLGVRADLVQGLDGLGIQTPTPVQSSAIPFLLGAGSDLIAQAQTGTGKIDKKNGVQPLCRGC